MIKTLISVILLFLLLYFLFLYVTFLCFFSFYKNWTLNPLISLVARAPPGSRWGSSQRSPESPSRQRRGQSPLTPTHRRLWRLAIRLLTYILAGFSPARPKFMATSPAKCSNINFSSYTLETATTIQRLTLWGF
jgi:hypothetical protein